MVFFKIYVYFGIILAKGLAMDNKYEDQLHDWTCHLNYRTPKDFNPQHSFSFGFCFKDPSIYCRQHAVTMNGCKRYRNMGLYCCLMEHAENSIDHITHPLLTKDMFLSLTSNNPRSNRMYHFLLMDTKVGNITSPEEMAVFLSIVLMDTHFLLNMEEHLPRKIAKNITLHAEREDIKYVGRGAIFVKGRHYYEWISNELNEDLRRQEGHNKTLINALEAPEVLLFPTSAFRAAALTWLKSYSVIEKLSLGNLFKRLSDGNVDNLATILYHLKGDIEQLPTLVDLWQRVRKVMKCTGEITSKNSLHGSCRYESFCRGAALLDEQDICGDNLPKKIFCKDCNRSLEIYLIINPELQQSEIKGFLSSFVKDVYGRTNGSTISVQFAMNTELEYTFKYEDEEDLMLFLEAIPAPISLDFPTLLNSTIRYINKIKTTKDKTKKVILIVSKDLPTLNGHAVDEITHAENYGINFYSLYTRHRNEINVNSTFILDSRQMNLHQHDIIERLCNDPTYILTNSSQLIKLSKFEKISFTIRLKFRERNVRVTLKTMEGEVTTRIDDSLISKYPYDKDVEFSLSYTVRSSYRIKDTYARFYGGIVTMQIVALPDNNKITYEPSSYDTNIIIEGMKDTNVFQLIVTDLEKLEKPITGMHLPMMLQVSVWICIILLVMLIIIYLPNIGRIINKLKSCVKTRSGHSQEYTLQGDKMKCPLCLRTLCDNNNVETVQTKEKDIVAEESPTSKHRLIVCRQGSIPKCDDCVKRLDLQASAHIHGFRIVMFLMFEILLLVSTFNDPVNESCSVVAGALIFIMHLILFSFTSEIIHHMSWGKVVRRPWWWLLVTGYSVVVSVALESMDPPSILHCWAIINNVQGKIILASEVAVVSVTFMLLIFSIVSNRNVPVYKLKHSVASFLLSLLFVGTITILTVHVHLDHSVFTKVTFAVCNILLVLGIIIFALVVQIESNDWIRSLCFIKKVRAICCHVTDKGTREMPLDETLRQSFKKKDAIVPQQQIKKLLVMPLQPNSCCTSPNTRKSRSPTMPYSIQSVLCKKSDDEDDESLDNEYDNSFEIIVRSKRQRSASAAGLPKTNFMQKPQPVKHHSHESVHPKNDDVILPGSLKKEKPQVNLDTYNVATFVTASPPVIEISHLEEQ